jgi:hypothetical protein
MDQMDQNIVLLAYFPLMASLLIVSDFGIIKVWLLTFSLLVWGRLGFTKSPLPKPLGIKSNKDSPEEMIPVIALAYVPMLVSVVAHAFGVTQLF